MSECRIARRVACAMTAGIPHDRAAVSFTLATKVLHWPFRFFSRGGGPRQPLPPVMDSDQVAGLGGCATPDTGVGRVGGRGGVRRVAQESGAAFTPLDFPTLSTKEKMKGGSA